MKHRAMILAALGLGLLAARDARAHFLFVRIGPMAEGGRSAEVVFGEGVEPGDPKFVDRIAGTRLWVQTGNSPGTFTPLDVHKGIDRLRAHLPAGGSLAVIGSCRYGVIAREGQTPFLLLHYPKSVAGSAEKLNALKPWGAPHQGVEDDVRLEIVPTFEEGRVKLALLKDGVLVPGAAFSIVDADLKESKVKAGGDGQAAWTPPAPGDYAVTTGETLRQSGELDGKSYEEIRQFASLSFRWPLERRGADPAAVALFKKALATRATWEDFPGFTAKAEGSLDGRAFAGKVAVGPDGVVEVTVDEPLARSWVDDQLSSIAMHRIADDDREPPVLRFALDDDEDHPLGRLLAFEGGRFASSYRVKDGQITSVNRHMGKLDMTISVTENTPNAEGKFLPRGYVVQYWDAASGALSRVETVQEHWTRVGRWDLPARHSVATASGAGFSVRTLTLTDLAVMKPK